MEEAAALFKCTVRAGNRRLSRLNIRAIVEHIMQVLRNDFSKDVFASEYTKLLVKDVLSVRKYCSEMPVELWNELIILYGGIMAHPTVQFDQISVVKVIQLVCHHMAIQSTSLSTGSLFDDFVSTVRHARSEKVATVLGYVLAALNTFCQSVAIIARTKLCHLGETVFSDMLSIWKTSQLHVKDQVIQYFHFQLELHHPLGVVNESEGAQAANWCHWKRSIQQLYEVILLDLEQVQKDMSWKAPGRGITELKMGFVKLTLAVFHLIAALTSVEALDEPLIAFGRRRTVEAKWSCWCEALRNVIDHPPATVSWLQVLTMLLEKHPDCISDEDVVVLLDLVYVIQKETNWVKVVHWSMSCLRELAVACKGRLRQQHDQWMKVWATAVRLVSQHRCEEAAFDLLAALLQCNIVSPDIEPWRLLGQCIPSSQAVNFVLSHFQSHSIPENFKTNQGVVHGKDGTLFPLRRQLFDWLLPVPDKSLGRFTAEVTEDGNFKLDASSRASPPQAAQLLFALTQKDPKNAINTMQLSCAFSSVENEGSCQWDSFLCQMGQSYLCSTFSTLIEENKVAVTHLVTSRSVTSLQLLLCEQMAKLCEHLVTPFESKHCMSLQETKQAVLDTIKFAAYLCSIVIHTVSLLAFSNSVTLDGMEESDLIVSLSKLLQFLASQINELSFVQDEMDQSTYNVFTALQHLESMLFVLTCSANRTREEQEQLKKLRQICKTVIPSSLVHCLIRISDGQLQFSQPIAITSPTPVSGMAQSHMFKMSSSGEKVLSCADNSDKSESAVTSEIHSATDLPDSLMSPLNHSKGFKLRLLAVKLLTMLWCLWNDDNGVGNCEIVYKFVGRFLNTEDLDLSQLSDVHLVVSVCETLCSSSELLSLEMINLILEALRSVLAQQYLDQQIAVSVLDVLAKLAKHFQYPAEVLKVSNVGDTCNRVLEAFCSLLAAGKLASHTRISLVRVFKNFIKVDHKGQWTSVLQKKKSSEECNGMKITLHEVLIGLLADENHAVRMEASKIDVLFTREKREPCFVSVEPLHRSLQERMFSAVCESVKTLYSPPAEVDIALKEDDTQNRTASVLYAFVRVALCSPVCRKMALFQLFNYNQLDSIEITEKALRLLSSCLGYSTSKEFLEVHLEFLLYSWLGAKQTLSSYPFKFHGFSCRADFFHCYGKIAIPYALFYLDSQQPELIGGDLHCDWVELVKTSLSHCMTFILPAVAMQRSNAVETTSNEEREAVKLEQTRSRMMYHLLQNKMDILKILRNEIDSFVVELLLRMHEPCSGHSVYAKYASVSDPEPNPPYYTSHCIKTVLDYLVERYEEFASLVDLLAFRRDTIHCVLLSLKSILFKSQNYYEKKRVLMAYALFVDLMAAQIHTGLGGSRTYFFRDVVGTVVELLKHMHSSKQKETNCLAVWEKFMSLCCQILFVVCTAALGNCSQVLGSHLHIIVSCLTEIAARQQPAAQEALALLNVLIKNNYSRLKNFIASLDPFPDLELFNSLQRVYRQAQQEKGLLTLEKNVTRFMSVDRHCPAEARLEGLQSLKLQLKESTKEIGQLNPTTVRKLICHLIWLASFTVKVTSEQSCMVVSEVAACLGELGAIDIGSISLSTQIDEEENQPYHEAMLSFRIVSAGIRPCKLLHKLNALLTDDSVATAAASCLKSILATKYGSEFLVEYEEHGIDDLHEYLYPFKCEQEEELNNPVVTSCEEVFVRHVDQSDLWWPPGASGQRTHNQWVQDVTAAFLQSNGVTDPMLVLLQPACHAKVSFAEFLFPHLIHNILQSKNPVYCNVLSSQIQGFFSRLRSLKETTTDNDVSPHLITTVARESIKLLLNTINFLRTKDKKENSNSWENNFWLELNYLSLAEAAQMCSAYFMSLLYLEIWQDAKKSSRIAYFSTPQSSLTSPLLDVASSAEGLFRQDSLLMGSHHSVLLEAYSKIGEPDALQGAAVVCSEDASARLKIYEEEGQWTRALGSYDLQLQDCASGCKASVVESLKHLGLNHVAFTYMDGLWNTDPIEAAKMSEHQYEMAWRNCVWNLDIESRSVSSSTGYHHAVHSCLHALSNSEFGPFQSSLNQALKIVISDLAAASLESILGIYPMLARLQCLVEMKEICNVMKRNSSYDGVSSQWQHRLQLTQDHFVHVEPVLALRTSLLQIAVNRCHQLGASSGQSESLMTILVNHLQSQAEVASQASCHQVSQQALAKLKLLCNQLSSESTALNYQCRMKEAELFWLRGEEKVALRAIASLHNDLEKMQGDNDAVNALYPNVLLLHGNWLAESHSERPTIVVDKYLQPAANLLSQLEDNSQTESSLMKAYFSLARYGDQRYRKIADYMQSSDFEIKKELMQQQKEEFENLQLQRGTVSLPGSQQYWKRRNNTLRRQIEIDENEIKSLHEDSKSFALKSLKNYSLCMQTGDDYDLHVFRFCSLWMENSHQQDVCQLVQKEMNKLQSRKFIPLLYQLAARLTFNRQTNITSEFQATLSMLIKRMCLDHPHHCVLALMALTLADKDAEYSMSSNIRPSAKRPRLMKEKTDRDEYVIDEDKIRAAKEILATLRSQRASQIQDMEHLAHFYISLAYHITESQRFTRGAVKKVPSHLQKRISGLKEVAVPTVELMVDPTCRYDNIICVNNFEPSFTEAGGVNHPKIVTCIGSDGRRRRQLVKGKDDLRQDAVMQQVFALVNKLLQKKAATRKRKLTIRTYKVIPLSQRSGVVEWCEGTVPLGIYLVGEGTDNSKGAHRKYEPNDWTSHKCRIKLSEAANKDRAIKLKSYMTITEHFHPVFRHFFRESFPDPAIWFERRLAYTRSLAAASIVGYIVGLGDRHPQNILIDRNTAEVIHIDFGVAFEQGRALPTPETVPFRLTRDLVDGMGVTGVEGIFRRACEETLIVMRGNVEAVLTILEVLLHDPLYDWSMNPVKALNLQENSESTDDASMAALAGDISHPSSASANVRTASVTSGQVSSKTNNKMAVRVLLRLRQKLEGVENSVPMSVAGQVNHLIQEAVDPENLCRVYSGWQPWI